MSTEAAPSVWSRALRLFRVDVLPVAALVLVLWSSAGSARAQSLPRLEIAPGTVHSGDLVAMSRDLWLAGSVKGTVVAVAATTEIAGTVSGDVVLVGGRAVISSGARIEGNLLSIGCELVFPARGTGVVGGREFSLSALETAFLIELQTSPLVAARGIDLSPVLLAFRLALLLSWLVAGYAILFFVPRRISVAADAVPGRLLFVSALGTTALLTGALASAFALAILPAWLGVLTMSLFVALLAVLKLFGLVSVFLALGRRLTRGAVRGSALFGDPSALTVGLLVLGLPSLLPVAGPLLWGLASLAAIGLALETLFGARAIEAGAGEPALRTVPAA